MPDGPGKLAIYVLIWGAKVASLRLCLLMVPFLSCSREASQVHHFLSLSLLSFFLSLSLSLPLSPSLRLFAKPTIGAGNLNHGNENLKPRVVEC